MSLALGQDSEWQGNCYRRLEKRQSYYRGRQLIKLPLAIS